MTNFVIGSSGRLGRVLKSNLASGDTVGLDRAVYSAWADLGAAEHVTRYFEPFAFQQAIIFVAAGVIDPRRPAEDHRRVNSILPRNIIDGVSRLGIRVVTFGTIMEEIVGRDSGSPYFDSKLQLGDDIEKARSRGADVLHLRIHTLYGGGPPDRSMFVGQLMDAIRRGDSFKMSAGTQLREYHHLDDELNAIELLARSNLTGAFNLNHGAPVRLVDLARHICAQFGRPDGLEVGALPSPGADNYDRVFERPAILADLTFRETLGSVVDYMRSYLNAAR